MTGKLRIDGVTVYVAENPEGEGVFLPFVCAEEARAASLLPLAQEIADTGGLTVRVLRFSGREEIGRLLPRPKP